MPTEIQPGTRVGQFEVERLIGFGPVSRVYRARQAGLDRAVALKVLNSDADEDSSFRERFLREGRLLAKLEHPHIVPVYEAGIDDNHLFLAVEVVEGGTLSDLLAGEGRLSLERTLSILAPVGEALEHAHRQGFVHRDVKPGNILIDHDGTVYLTDFGLAADLEHDALTISGQATGTHDYMAPEQIRGEPLSARTDVYGLGCLAFECLTGKPPFADRQGMRVLWAHLQDEPPSPSQATPGLSARVDAAFRRALAKDPGDRQATAGEFVAELNSTLDTTTHIPRSSAIDQDTTVAMRDAIEPGTKIGQFEVEALIGAGAMGWVYRARQPSLDRTVALKVLLPELAHDERVVARFQQEGTSLARLRHRHIVTVYGAGRDGDHLFLAMQLVQGGTLRHLLADTGLLRPERALPILTAVAEALDHAHKLRLVHRDVKPANILIGRDGRVYLSDFGITRTLEQTAALTATGGMVGTPLYMAPEQADPDRAVGPPCDIYALGCVAFECLTGSPPYAREDHWALLFAHATQEVPSAGERNPSLPSDIDSVFHTALAKDPEDRFATADELIVALRSTL